MILGTRLGPSKVEIGPTLCDMKHTHRIIDFEHPQRSHELKIGFIQITMSTQTPKPALREQTKQTRVEDNKAVTKLSSDTRA